LLKSPNPAVRGHRHQGKMGVDPRVAADWHKIRERAAEQESKCQIDYKIDCAGHCLSGLNRWGNSSNRFKLESRISHNIPD